MRAFQVRVWTLLATLCLLAGCGAPNANDLSSLARPLQGDAVQPGLGPNGERPLPGLSEDDFKAIAEGSGMSPEDTRFILGEGSGIVLAFKANNEHRDDFGAVRVL